VIYNFLVRINKDNRKLILETIILVVETDIPPLATSSPPGYLGRRINLNEELEFTIIPQAS
jgi:hypothetical protein